MPKSSQAAIEIRTHASVSEFGADGWQRLVQPDTPPFLHYEWLHALETAECAVAERGWLPLFLGFWRGGSLLAAAPAYVKAHSMGEFVFDHAWAQFAEQRLGLNYYPKLVVAVPFTPATGPRLLMTSEQRDSNREELMRAFAVALPDLVEKLGVSGAHVLFPDAEDARLMADTGLLHRYGVQFHWRNAGYGSFEDFLLRFKSKRRNQLRRERSEVARQGLELRVLTGSDLTPAVVDHVFECYKRTIDRYFWGRQYLNREFFEEVASKMSERLLVVLATHRSSGKHVAAAFNLLGNNALYGRYWGAVEEYRFLHFNVCFYAGIDACIERGLEVFEPGAGGEHKLARGFEPTLTHSVHCLRHPVLNEAVSEHVARERCAVAEEVEQANRESALRESG